MRTFHSSFHARCLLRRSFYRGVITTLVAVALLLQSATAEAPGWWVARGVFKEGTPEVDDYRALNQGQLKNLVRAAVDEMNDTLPGGAGTTLNTLLATWRTGVANGTADNYAAVNVGQLKAMGKLVRARLTEVGLTPPGMGTETTADDDDYVLANVGQAKAVFAFGIVDPHLNDDDDDDGLTNSQEVALGTDPNEADTDGDGVDDGDEVEQNTDATSATSNLQMLVGLRLFTPVDAL